MNFTQIINYINNLPYNLDHLSQDIGIYIYVVIGIILSLETGGVILNFLPGDTLVFAAATLAASTDLIDIRILVPLSIISSFLGDNLNYKIGTFMGKLYLKKGKMKLINKTQFDAARSFIQERGRKGFLINRFIPLARVYVVFLTGFLQTDYSVIFPYHLIGVLIWNAVYLILGYYFGNLSFVKENYMLVLLMILLLSVLPALVVFIKNFSSIKESDLYRSFFDKEYKKEMEEKKNNNNNSNQKTKSKNKGVNNDENEEEIIDTELFNKDIFDEENKEK